MPAVGSGQKARQQTGPGVTVSGRDASIALGKSLRTTVPRESHAEFVVAPDRDPIGLLLSQSESRNQQLVPVRHGRMLVSPFTFFRGAALPMADDLAKVPSTSLSVQLCGDAHLANFGMYASHDRRLVFDLNDFDETLPGPFEWDVKRLAASFVIAARNNGFSKKGQRAAALEAVGWYRTTMREFAAKPMLNVWYARVDVQNLLASIEGNLSSRERARASTILSTVRTRTSMQALDKLTRVIDGRRRIISNPPLVVPVEEIAPAFEVTELYRQIERLIRGYCRTLQSDRRFLLSRFRLQHMAHKVVGVGSVGTGAWILLMEADDGDVLFLQAKEAQTSVLAAYLGKSQQDNQGQRVVHGQHLMQASSDIFLGWQRTPHRDGGHTDHYVRQLRDWKYAPPIEEMPLPSMVAYARLCGWTLARAHARSGDRFAIAAYLGKSSQFDEAVTEFAMTYADQTERDYTDLAKAVKTGRAMAQHGV